MGGDERESRQWFRQTFFISKWPEAMNSSCEPASIREREKKLHNNPIETNEENNCSQATNTGLWKRKPLPVQQAHSSMLRVMETITLSKQKHPPPHHHHFPRSLA